MVAPTTRVNCTQIKGVIQKGVTVTPAFETSTVAGILLQLWSEDYSFVFAVCHKRCITGQVQITPHKEKFGVCSKCLRCLMQQLHKCGQQQSAKLPVGCRRKIPHFSRLQPKESLNTNRRYPDQFNKHDGNTIQLLM